MAKSANDYSTAWMQHSDGWVRIVPGAPTQPSLRLDVQPPRITRTSPGRGLWLSRVRRTSRPSMTSVLVRRPPPRRPRLLLKRWRLHIGEAISIRLC